MSEGLILNGRFRLLEELGRGGMGSVWRAFDMALEAEAAVKLIDASLLQTEEALARFKREAKAAAAIRSTHVVQILEYGVQNIGDTSTPLPYIAMELLKGESLAKRLERVGKLPADRALPILTHIARALSLAHANGIVHRDLKPDNVFLVREMDDDVGKVLDFGIARQLGSLAQTGGLQTQSGAVLGTPYYMSPEQTIGQAVDARSDIWSFGVIAFECLAGMRPFDQDTLGGLFHAICVAELPVPSSRGEVPPGFDEWFARATARDRELRFQKIEDAIAELRTCCGRSSGRPLSAVSRLQHASVPARSVKFGYTPPPASQTIPGLPPPRPWLPFAIALPILGCVIAGGFVGWKQLQSSAATPMMDPALPTSPTTAVAVSVAPPTQPEVSPVPVASVSSAPSTAPDPQAMPVRVSARAYDSPATKGAGRATPKNELAPAKAPATESKPEPKTEPKAGLTAVSREPTPAQPAAPPSPPIKRKDNVAGF